MAGSVPISEPSEEKENKPARSFDSFDGDRMAGAKSDRKKAEKTDQEEDFSAEGEEVVSEDTDDVESGEGEDLPEKVYRPPPPLPVNFTVIESHGTLSGPQDGGLGVDLWDGTDRTKIAALIPALTDDPAWPALKALQRRLLLTVADAGMMRRHGRLSAGADLFTLRIEKLLEMGLFSDAAALYTEEPESPYHERLARAGVLALLYDGQISLACLEAKALSARYSSSSFWEGLSKVCGHIFLQEERQAVSGSSLLTQLVQKASFRFSVQSPEDLSGLTSLEMALLFGTQRVDYTRMKTVEKKDISPLLEALFLKDPNFPRRLFAAISPQSEKKQKKNSRVKAILDEKNMEFTSLVYQKLNPSEKNDNLVENKGYGKKKRLTESAGYVMDRGSFLDRLAKARRERRLGETVLLSAVLLGGEPAESPDPDVFQAVLESLIDVGLTKEARALAADVVTGL